MNWPPTNYWTAPKTIDENRHFQLKAFGGKNLNRWVDLFPIKNKHLLIRISWERLKSNWTIGCLRLP